MRNLCLVFAFTSGLCLAAGPAAPKDSAKALPKASAPVKVVPTLTPSADPAAKAPVVPPAAPVPVPAVIAPEPAIVAPTPEVLDTTKVAHPDTTVAAAPTPPPAAPPMPPAAPPSRALFQDYTLVAKEYTFGILGQTVAGALGFFIGSAIETAFQGEEEAHKGTLSFTGIRYDNYYGAFWGGAVGGLMGSSLTVYFTGQSDEEDGSLFWTMVGTAAAGAGAMYTAHLMGVNDDVDWKPFIPLLAIPTAGSVAGFNLSRWFSDRKRESIMGPDASIRLYPPRLGMSMTPEGERLHLHALNLRF